VLPPRAKEKLAAPGEDAGPPSNQVDEKANWAGLANPFPPGYGEDLLEPECDDPDDERK
jgi:hypothetical protein